MISKRPSSVGWKDNANQWKRCVSGISLLASIIATGVCYGTGFYGPSEYLDEAQHQVDATPEFYWEWEVKRLSKEFHPSEKPISWAPVHTDDTGVSDSSVQDDATAKADTDDFAAALKEGRIKPPDPTKAAEQHDAARKVILTAKPNATEESATPDEFDSEFADYHRGALAYRRGKWDEAKAAWTTLLKRPEEQRHYRTIWATFMLGKAGLKTSDPDAVKWFQWTRELAKQGFADSLNMAAASYGWEGRSEWKQGHPEKAAPLYLNQLALGDESAVISLKALIPDRQPIGGMLNYDIAPEQNQDTPEQQKAEQERTLQALRASAKDPLLRRLETVHILAAGTAIYDYDDMKKASMDRASRWLQIVSEAKIDKLEDAEHLGWVAYLAGDYRQAAHWLDVADPNAPAAAWLRAKLELRDGKLADAAKNMHLAWKGTVAANSVASKDDRLRTEYEYMYEGHFPFNEEAAGDLAKLRLSRGDFIQALDVLYGSGMWQDAAYVAERVLTADELKGYVDKQPPATESSRDATDHSEGSIKGLRYLLGRRLIREDRYSDAAKYLIPPYDKLADIYAKALQNGSNEKLPKQERARSLFTAAWIARYDGMELMGTEVAPDSFYFQGDFQNTDIAQQRKTGTFEKTIESTGDKAEPTPLLLKATKQEIQRLDKNKIGPDLRFHYRYVAAALAIRASHLLQDNTEELADVVNTAGHWIKNSDGKLGDRYYQIIEKRCAKTKIGAACIAKHWFTEDNGPWSNDQQKIHDSRDKELGIKRDQE